ncbi:hypothetical protein D3C79_850520 [compost metagenome]
MRVTGLLVVEGLEGQAGWLHPSRRRPRRDRVGGFGDRSTVVADQRLALQLRKHAAVIADDHAMAFLGVLEGEEQPFLLEQAQHEIQVRFLILRAVADWLERLAQAELMLGQGQVVIENFLDDLLGGLVLEDA